MTTLQTALAVTMGDPAGVGPELILKSWKAREVESLSPFFAIADPQLFPSESIEVISAPQESLACFAKALPVLPLPLTTPAVAGQADATNAHAIIESIRQAYELASKGDAAAIITAPINKNLLYQEGFEYPGQTEFLASLAHIESSQVVMMLAAPELRVVPLTIHIPIKQVSDAITEELIINRAKVILKALKQDFASSNPTLAVCGLNPHAGEAGHIGDEEIRVIAPALEKLRAQGHNVTGPASADTLFHEQARGTYDAVLAMYHDQALIPLKTLDFFNGVNTTLGLPIVRTSPDHGTAYNIAGQNKADPRSMIAALKLARFQAQNRAQSDS
ncbi:MAG: 4-hydroxythreonine-4-phosphate dehydrogenase PdxA [Sphingomonadales bacterium]|jgi:4-hydroxythreonine-4-phosphate dehydrogenase